jgi:hypothetical protein
MVPHQYGSRPGCMYCDASRADAGRPCATAAEVEAHWMSWSSLGYDPDGHLRVLVASLCHRTQETLTVELLTAAPEVRFVVRRGPEIIAQAANLNRAVAARETAARLWRWQARRYAAGGR